MGAGSNLPLLNKNRKFDSEDVQYRKDDNQSDQNVAIDRQPEDSNAIRFSEQSDPGSPIYAALQNAGPTRMSYSSRSNVRSNPYASPYEELQSMSRHSGDQSNFEQTTTNQESNIEPYYSVVDKSKKTSKTTLPKN